MVEPSQVVETGDAKLTDDQNRRTAFERWLKSTREYLEEHPDGWTTPPAKVLASEGFRRSSLTRAEFCSKAGSEG